MTNKLKAQDPTLNKIIIQSIWKDLLFVIPILPLYSLCEVSLAIIISAFLQLLYDSKKVFTIHQLVPGNFQKIIHFNQEFSLQQLIFILPISVVVVGFFKLIFSFLSNYIIEKSGYKLSSKLKEKMLQKYLESQGNVLDSMNSNQIANQIMQDSNLIQGAIRKGTLSSIRDLIVVLGIVISMLYISVRFFLCVIIFFIPLFFMMKKLASKMNYLTQEGQKKQIQMSSRFLETHLGNTTVWGLRAQFREYFDLKKQFQSYFDFMKNGLFVRTFFSPFKEFLAILFLLGIFQGKLFLESRFDAKAFTSIIILFAFSIRYLKNISETVVYFSDITVVFRRVSEFLNKLQFTPLKTKNILNKRSSDLALDIHKLSYVLDSEKKILNQIDMKITKGQKVAIIGESGSGKTTLLRIIAGLLNPTHGQIQIYQDCLLATQIPYVFQGTVKENIIYCHEGKYQHEDVRIEDLLMLFNLSHSSLSSRIFSQKEIGLLGEGASGGEQARIALARIFYADPQMILLDEPTASLDSETAAAFWNGVLKWHSRGGDRTIVAVTHVKSDLKYFDNIYKCERGEIFRTEVLG